MTGSNGREMHITTPSDTEVEITRIFDAPRDLVFEAHTSCEHLSHWWGPRRYEVADCEIDFRPGGTWRMVHRAAGEEHTFRGEYRDIVRPERITWTFEWMGLPGHVSVDTVTFEDRDGKTLLTTRSVFDSKEDRDGMLRSGMETGLAETWERLDDYLEAMASTQAGRAR
jgi:uncharacterized protein YndB with AHSA1/START domain